MIVVIVLAVVIVLIRTSCINMNHFEQFQGSDITLTKQQSTLVMKKKSSSTGLLKPKRGQANKRERVRTENVNAGFDNLRKLIPTDPEDRKLSKIEVLRLATSYINHLFNLTRADSCMEAETNDKLVSESSSEEDDDGDNDEEEEVDNKHHDFVSGDTNKRSNKTMGKFNRNHHVCTFCLMMTKLASSTTATKSK